MSNFYSTLQTTWTAECVAVFGRPLPITHIGYETIEHRVGDMDDPLTAMNGQVARTFRLVYDFRSMDNERQSIN